MCLLGQVRLSTSVNISSHVMYLRLIVRHVTGSGKHQEMSRRTKAIAAENQRPTGV